MASVQAVAQLSMFYSPNVFRLSCRHQGGVWGWIYMIYKYIKQASEEWANSFRLQVGTSFSAIKRRVTQPQCFLVMDGEHLDVAFTLTTQERLEEWACEEPWKIGKQFVHARSVIVMRRQVAQVNWPLKTFFFCFLLFHISFCKASDGSMVIWWIGLWPHSTTHLGQPPGTDYGLFWVEFIYMCVFSVSAPGSSYSTQPCMFSYTATRGECVFCDVHFSFLLQCINIQLSFKGETDRHFQKRLISWLYCKLYCMW